MTILHIDSSANLKNSNSRTISAYIVEKLKAESPGELQVIRRDLANDLLPQISAADLVDLHASATSESVSLSMHLALSDTLIAELKTADTLVIGLPLYNFGVPVVFKQWVDYVARAGHTFRYTEQGPVGLSGVNRAFVVIASGGTPVGSPMDHLSHYIKTILRFIGVKEVHIIDAAGSKGATDKVIAQAKSQVDNMLAA
jgi:FMN-dependent NADH-azoreductase